MAFFSHRSVKEAAKSSSLGPISEPAVESLNELLQEIILKVVPEARKMANRTGRKTIQDDDIRVVKSMFFKEL